MAVAVLPTAPAVTLTVTSSDTTPAAVATTRTVCAPPSSDTPVIASAGEPPSSKLNQILLSSSKIIKLSVCTSKGAFAGVVTPAAVPENRMVSSPSAEVSLTGVTVKFADIPTVAPLLIVTIVDVAVV